MSKDFTNKQTPKICHKCGANFVVDLSPKTGRKIKFNLDGTQHWKTCSLEAQAVYSEHKRKAYVAEMENNYAFERALFS